LFGATGMIGQGVLRECLRDAGVIRVLSVGRRTVGYPHDKLREIVVPDIANLPSVEHELGGFDACFFCLGISSLGMSETDYRRITYDYALAAGTLLARGNPGMTFVFVSGSGADSTGTRRLMWARIKGETENALLTLPFRAVYIFRPGIVQPLDGIRSRTWWVNAAYVVARPLVPVLMRLAPRTVTTTERIGRAMLAAARRGAGARVLENADINALAGAGGSELEPTRR
jgi:uncharacterized protein YbjT (DUF2867 family)